MILTLEDTLSGFTIELKIQRQTILLSSRFLIIQSPTVCLIMEWLFQFIRRN